MMDYTQALLIAAATFALGFWAGWQLGKIRGWGEAQEDAKTAEIAMQQHKVAEELLREAEAKKDSLDRPPAVRLPDAYEDARRAMIAGVESMGRTGKVCLWCQHRDDTASDSPCSWCGSIENARPAFLSILRRPEELTKAPSKPEEDEP